MLDYPLSSYIDSQFSCDEKTVEHSGFLEEREEENEQARKNDNTLCCEEDLAEEQNAAELFAQALKKLENELIEKNV